MESVYKMLNVKDEQETASSHCHHGYLSAAKAQAVVNLGSQNHSESESAWRVPPYVHRDTS